MCYAPSAIISLHALEQDSKDSPLYHTGLSRLVAANLRDEVPPIQCVFINEDDPKLDKAIGELVTLAFNRRFHSTALIIAVPSVTATAPPVACDGGSDSELDEDFGSKVDKLGSDLVSGPHSH